MPLASGSCFIDTRSNTLYYAHYAQIYYHFYEYPAEHSVKRHYGVRTDRWKLIHFYNNIDEWELFDLKNDPHELNNIYGQPGTEKITKELRKELHRLQGQYRDPIESQLK